MMKCIHCGVKDTDCRPGGTWHEVCPFHPECAGHEWVDDLDPHIHAGLHHDPHRDFLASP